jgi:uncharacterized membrane protein YcgQ (UPF0703/DUF1980 family)
VYVHCYSQATELQTSSRADRQPSYRPADTWLTREGRIVGCYVKDWAVRNQVISAVAVHCAMQHSVRKSKGET